MSVQRYKQTAVVPLSKLQTIVDPGATLGSLGLAPEVDVTLADDTQLSALDELMASIGYAFITTTPASTNPTKGFTSLVEFSSTDSNTATAPSTTARLRYDDTTKKLLCSMSGGAYQQIGGTVLATGASLTDANDTITVAQRYVLPTATLSTDRTLTITPPGQVGAGFLIEVGTQGAGFDYSIINGGPGGGTLYAVLGGTRFAVWAVSDGTNMLISACMPLGEEP